MRLTDDRYAGERRQFELALRMIGHEARTRTIRECTGLSDDRIRKLYTNYFKHDGKTGVRRRRGKSPRQITRFVKNPVHQLQATTLVALFCAGRILRIDEADRVHNRWPRPNVEYGHRVCRAFENYCLLHDRPLLNFEWTWNLLVNLTWNDELYLAACRGCDGRYVQDAYALDDGTCPACAIESDRTKAGRKRAGSASSMPPVR